MENLTDLFKKQFNQEANMIGLTGIDQAKARKEFTENKKSEDDDIRNKSKDYLKDGVDLSDIMKLVKNKKLTNNKIKGEIRKLLKEPEELKDFLKSLISKDKTETKEATGTGSSGSDITTPLFSGEEPKKVEATEATSSGAGVGAYETNRIWAKTTSKKNWKPSRKTQIPGGKFVQVKKKCKRFPYCNQGDIKALNIFENETVKNVIEKVSNTYNLHEEHIKDIILYELRKTNK
jgi:hypothetical protein